MIPTLIVAGLVFGRWWRAAPVVAAAGWALLLAVDGAVPHAVGPLAAAAGLAAVNTATGVAINRGTAWLWRQLTPKDA